MPGDFTFLVDGVEHSLSLPDVAHTHPLPSEVITAALDATTYATLNLARSMVAPDEDTRLEILQEVIMILLGPRTQIGFRTAAPCETLQA